MGNSVPLSPTTIYGVSKHFMENMGNYYFNKFKTDFRSIRLPGVVSPYEIDYFGSTDYSSEIFFAAIRNKSYSIPLSPNRRLPFVYLDDIIKGIMQLMEEDKALLTTRVYNIQALSFSCEDLVSEMKKKFINFCPQYDIDFRDEIVKNWPETLDDTLSRRDWKWEPKCVNLKDLINSMVNGINLKNIL